MGTIQVRRCLHIEQTDYLQDVEVPEVGYISTDRNILVESVLYGSSREFYFRSRGLSDQCDKAPPLVLRLSEDNGRSWREIETWTQYHHVEGPWRWLRWSPTYVYGPGGQLARLCMGWLDVEGLVSWDKGNPTPISGLVFVQLSNDLGRTWSPMRQMVFAGEEYNGVHWGPGLWFGRNRGVLGGPPVYLDDGRFMLTFGTQIVGEPADPMTGRHQSACLFGRFAEDGSGIAWEMTSYATVGAKQSFYGGVEPSAAMLKDGRLWLTMRVHVHRDGGFESGGRYYVTSDDMGRTWSEPQVMRYDDTGEKVHIPACLAHVLRSSRNGRLYMITNIVDEPAYACDPRTTLQIAEIEEPSLRVIRDSITVIESRRPDQPEYIRFSNWARYEDRETGNLVMLMSENPGNVGRHEECGVEPHSYRYEIELPE
ncbi:MAG: exo-alpha-sialidase [Phycisphaerae bacterium]|mgnify:FL=1|nr:exo-alpha-sialidase [Phycisphaerae bacterium]